MTIKSRRHGATLAQIEAVYRERLDEFRSVAAAILEDRQPAADVVQEAFALAVRSRAAFRGDGSLDAWLWRTVVNAALSERRRPIAVPTDKPPLEPSWNGHSELADVQLAIAVLPERQRLALFLRYYADLDYQAIADVLDVRPGTVGAMLNAAHAALRRTLEEVPR